MDNYVRVAMTGCHIMMKRHVVPHIFNCQISKTQSWQQMHLASDKSAYTNGEELEIIESAISEYSSSSIMDDDLNLQYTVMESNTMELPISEADSFEGNLKHVILFFFIFALVVASTEILIWMFIYINRETKRAL